MFRLLITIFLVLYFFASCNNRTYSKLMNHEKLFFTYFINHSLLIRGDVIELQVYKDHLLNNYFFKLQEKKLLLTRDSIQFNINELPKYNRININNQEEYSKQIEESASQLLSKMREAGVSSFTSEFGKFGIDLMINAKGQKLLYVSDSFRVTNPEWKKFLAQSKKIKDHWYLYKTSD